MPYTPSTQRVGFKNRAIDKSAANRGSQQVADMTANMKETVSGMQKYASDQKSDMTRISGLEAERIKYENSNAKATIDSILNFGEKVVVPVAKMQRESATQKGIDLYRACEAGDQEACAKIDQTDKQIEEYNRQVQEHSDKANTTADELEQYAIDLEQKQRLANVRKLGSNVARGYRQALLSDSAEGYKSWRDDQLSSSNDIVWFDKEQKVGAAVNTYHDQDHDGKAKITKYLENKYITDNSYDMSPSFVQRYLTKSIVTQTNKIQEQEYNVARREDAALHLEDLTNNFNNAAKNIESRPEDAKQSIQSLLNNLSSIHNRLGTQGSNRIAAKNTLIKMIKDATSYREFKEGVNVEDMEDMYTFLDETKFHVPWMGNKAMTLSELWPSEANTDQMRAGTLEAYYTRARKEDQAVNQAFQTEITKLQEIYRQERKDGDPSAKKNYDAARNALRNNEMFQGGTQVHTIANDAAAFEPGIISEKAADEMAKEILKENTFILLEQTKKWPTSVFEVYDKAGQIRERAYARINEKGSQGNLAYINGNKTIKNTLEKYAKRNLGTNALDSNSLNNAYKYVEKQIIREAEYIEASQGLSQVDALKQAYAYYNQRIKADNGDANPVVIRPEDPTSGKSFKWNTVHSEFEDFVEAPVQESPFASITRIKSNVTEASNKINNQQHDVISKEVLTTKPEVDLKLETSKYGVPRIKEFIFEISKRDPLDRTIYEVFNLQRKAAGLEEVDWSDPKVDPTGTIAPLIKAYNEQHPAIRKLLKNGEQLGIDRAQHALGMLSVHGMFVTLKDTPIPERLFTPDLIQGAGLPSGMTYQEFQNNRPAQIRASQFEINRLATIAQSQTNDVNAMVRMVATGLEFGEDQMGNWNVHGSETEKFSLNALNSYLSGSEDKVNYFKDKYIAAETSIERVGAEPTNNLVGIREQLTTLKENRPENRHPDGTVIKNSEGKSVLNEWKSKVSVLEALERANVEIQGGAAPAMADVRKVIGPERYKDLLRRAKSNRSVLIKLINEQPEFQLPVDKEDNNE